MSKIARVLKTSTIILGIASFGLATTTQAWADGRRGDRDHREYRHDRHNKHDNHYRYNKHHNYKYKHNKHYYYRPHHYDHVRYNYRPHRGHRTHFRAHGHGNDVALGILAGGLLVYGLSQAAQANNQPDVVYVPAAQPAPAAGRGWATSVPAQQVSYNHGTCLQEREYQTSITVGNEVVPAYGTACLQPDGSWKFGPAKQVPEYAR